MESTWNGNYLRREVTNQVPAERNVKKKGDYFILKNSGLRFNKLSMNTRQGTNVKMGTALKNLSGTSATLPRRTSVIFPSVESSLTVLS